MKAEPRVPDFKITKEEAADLVLYFVAAARKGDLRGDLWIAAVQEMVRVYLKIDES